MSKDNDNTTYNVTSNNQFGGITAGVVNVAPPQRKLDSDNKAHIRATIPTNEPVAISCMGNDPESTIFADEICAWMLAEGYTIVANTRVMGMTCIGQEIKNHPNGYQIIGENKTCNWEIIVGHQRR